MRVRRSTVDGQIYFAPVANWCIPVFIGLWPFLQNQQTKWNRRSKESLKSAGKHGVKTGNSLMGGGHAPPCCALPLQKGQICDTPPTPHRTGLRIRPFKHPKMRKSINIGNQKVRFATQEGSMRTPVEPLDYYLSLKRGFSWPSQVPAT